MGAEFHITSATVEHIDQLLPHVRQADIDEAAAFDTTPEEVMLRIAPDAKLHDALSPTIKVPGEEVTIGEMRDHLISTVETQRVLQSIKLLPTSDPARDQLRDIIAKQIQESTRVFTTKEATEIADLYAKVITVQAPRVKSTPQELYEKVKLTIVKDIHAKLEASQGEGYGLTGDGRPTGIPPTSRPAEGQGRELPGLHGAPGLVRSGVVGEGEAPAGGVSGAAAVERLGVGPRPPARTWHGTAANGFASLQAEGLARNQTGGMGPGLHISAGPQVAHEYAKDLHKVVNASGLWAVGTSRDYTPFDASIERKYSVEDAAKLGIATSRAMSGDELWRRSVSEIGEDATVQMLQALGFHGLYYSHGGEDAWSVWRNEHLFGSKPTDLEAALEHYKIQGSRRDELTGEMKVNQPDQAYDGQERENGQQDPREAQRAAHRAAEDTSALPEPEGDGGLYEGAPWSYRRRVQGDGGVLRVLGVPVHETWSLPEASFPKTYKDDGCANPEVHELDYTHPDAARTFREAISTLKENNKYAASVHVYEEAEYAGMRIFLTGGHPLPSA